MGPYEVLAPLGSGGMGDVYRARDAKLGREVALKVLPRVFARDPERRLRFEQEARAASALNHPNIVTVHDIGGSESTLYIAMELVEGRTLREVLSSGPLPTKKLLDIAIQAADGLAKAHTAGIVHRDLKPENLMVSKDGHVKVLDFGIAKLPTLVSQGAAEQSTSPNLALSGTVIGTAAYMSPEQASGRAVDFRSDQFAIGSILYEMASGRRAFERRTAPEILAAIIRDEPEPLDRLSPGIPAPLRWTIEQCLAKDPEQRYASTRDLMRDLQKLRDHLPEASALGRPSPAAHVGSRRWTGLAAMGLAALALLALGFFAAKRTGTAPAMPSFRRLTFRRGALWSARFAPDGQTVLYAAAWEERPLELFSTRTDSPESRSLDAPPGDILAVSSSGEMALSLGRHYVVGWETSGTLARMSLAGGAPREVLDNVHAADWGSDGKALAVVRDLEGRRRLEFPVGNALYETGGWIGSPKVSPHGDLIAFLDHPLRGPDSGSVAVVDLKGRKRKLSTDWGAIGGLAWSPGGKEVWFTAGDTGMDLQLRAVTLSGSARLVLTMAGGMRLQDVHNDGRVLLSRQNWRREIRGLAPGETKERSLSWLDWSFPAHLSGDGKLLLIAEEGEGGGAPFMVYVRRTDGAPAVRLGEGRALALSTDGRWALVLAPPVSEPRALLLPTGAGEAHPFPSSGLAYQWVGWFPSGDRVLIAGREPGRGTRLYILEMPQGSRRPMTPEGVSVLYGDPISPDGRFVAAQGPEGNVRVYPVEAGESRGVPGLSREDVAIRWTSDGRSLYTFRTAEMPAKVHIVDIATGRRSLWRELAPPDPAGVSYVGPILISRDGSAYAYSYRRFLDDLYLVEGLK